MAVTISTATTTESPFLYVELVGNFSEVFEELALRTEPSEPTFRVIWKGATSVGSYKYVLSYKKTDL